MKILQIGSFNTTFSKNINFFSFDKKISRGLQKNGYDVFETSFNELLRFWSPFKSRKHFVKAGYEKLIDAVTQIKPDIILIGHIELDKNYLMKIKSLLPNVSVLAYCIDAPEKKRIIKYKDIAELVDCFFFAFGGETLKEVKKFIHYKKASYIPYPVDLSIDRYKSFEKKAHDNDVLLVADDRKKPERKNFISNLVKNSNDDIKWYLRGCYGNSNVNGSEYYNALNKSKFGINLSAFVPNNYHLYSSDRISQLTGNGLLALCQECPSMRSIYNDNEVVYFNGHEDLRNNIEYFLNNQKEANEIAENGYNKAHRAYNSERVSKYIIECSTASFSEDYEWANNIY